jgi:hypothetical protein
VPGGPGMPKSMPRLLAIRKGAHTWSGCRTLDWRAPLVRLTKRGWDVVTVGTRIIEEIKSAWAQLLGAQRM